MQNIHKFRENKTSLTNRKPQFTHKVPHHENTFLLTDRPNTTSLGTTRQSFLYRDANLVELQLTQTFKQEMSEYFKNKIRKWTLRQKQTLEVDDSLLLEQTLNPEDTLTWDQNKPRNVRQMHLCNFTIHSCGKRKKEKVLGEPYYLNAKERINRLLSLKNDHERQYGNLQEHIKNKSKEKVKLRIKKASQFQPPKPVQNSDWDNEWRKTLKREKSRYRTRLTLKHNKKSKNVTIDW